MAVLEAEIAHFERLREVLERDYKGEWVLIHKKVLVGTYPTFEAAGSDAVKRFGMGPYLIRKVGAPPITLPASVHHRLTHGRN